MSILPYITAKCNVCFIYTTLPTLNQMRMFIFDMFRYFWGLAIDTVAVINLVLAVGLSVDYAAHVAHSFMIKTGTRDERMMQVCAFVTLPESITF